MKKEFYERGPEIFGGSDEVRQLREEIKEMTTVTRSLRWTSSY